MSFLPTYDAAPPEAQAGLLVREILSRPNELFAELQRDRPILVGPGPSVVTKFADCVEVLQRYRDFSVRSYAPKMEAITGPFFLGEDGTPLYERDTSAMRLVMHRDDLPRIREFLRDRAAAALLAAAPAKAGEIEIVSTLTRRLPAELMSFYLGVAGPDRKTLQLWGRELFREIFTNLVNDPGVTQRALALSEDMRRYIDGLIAERRAAGAGADTVLDRLLKLRCADKACLDDLSIRHNLIGLITGAIDTTSKAVINIVNEFLDYPIALLGATEAAKADDLAGLEAHCFEALRLRPQNSMLVRTCELTSVIAAGTDREAEIPAGKTVFVATSAAMRDPAVTPNPENFALGRPLHLGLHFGAGLHTCFGQYVNRVQIVEQIRALLRYPNLRRADGAKGHVRMDGPFPDALYVAFG